MVVPKEGRAQRLSGSLNARSRGLVFGHFCFFYSGPQQEAAALMLYVIYHEYAFLLFCIRATSYSSHTR